MHRNRALRIRKELARFRHCPMKKRSLIWTVVILVSLIITAISWINVPPPDLVFRGQLESGWIANLRYNDDKQVKEWQSYGPEGVQVLIRGMENAQRPWERKYRETYRKIPSKLQRLFPDPRQDSTRSPRTRMVSLLSRLDKDADSATPVMVQALKDENDSVRQLAVNFFTHVTYGDIKEARLDRIDKVLKKDILSLFIAGLQESNYGLRNNALIALRYYPEEKQAVTSAVIPILKDPEPMVRIRAVQTLQQIDSDATVSAGAVAEAVRILQHPDDQIASQAAEILGKMQKEPSLVVPALINAMNGTNSLVGSSAAIALRNFPEHADVIIPALHAMLQRTNSPIPKYNLNGTLREFELRRQKSGSR